MNGESSVENVIINKNDFYYDYDYDFSSKPNEIRCFEEKNINAEKNTVYICDHTDTSKHIHCYTTNKRVSLFSFAFPFTQETQINKSIKKMTHEVREEKER